MANSTTAANQTLPPPRRTGDSSADILSQIRWFNDFYDQITKVMNVPGVIQDLSDAGLVGAPAGWFASVNAQLAALGPSLTSLQASITTLNGDITTLNTTVSNLQAALTLAGIIPVTPSPALNATAIQLLVHNNGGVHLQPVTLTVADGAGVGFRAIVVPN